MYVNTGTKPPGNAICEKIKSSCQQALCCSSIAQQQPHGVQILINCQLSIMVKKRRIHAENVPLQNNRTSLALQLLHRELGGFSQHTAGTAAARSTPKQDAKQQLLESTLHLIDLQASTPGFFIVLRWFNIIMPGGGSLLFTESQQWQ